MIKDGKKINNIVKGVCVISTVLWSLYKDYMNIIPKELKKKLLELINETNSILDGNENAQDNFDIVKQTYILKTTYSIFENNIK